MLIFLWQRTCDVRYRAVDMAGKTGEVVIVGGGIIGCSIAYHLSELGVASTVVESCAVASAASGKAGGFLARYAFPTTTD